MFHGTVPKRLSEGRAILTAEINFALSGTESIRQHFRDRKDPIMYAGLQFHILPVYEEVIYIYINK